MTRWAAVVVCAGLLAGCGDGAVEADLAEARAALADALISARLAELRVSAELYLNMSGDVADLQREIAQLHGILEVGTQAKAEASLERRVKAVDAQLVQAKTEYQRDAGDAAAVATPRLAAAAEAAARARLWTLAVAVAERRAAALIPRLQEVAASEAPSQRATAAVLQELAGVRAVVETVFGGAEGDVGFSTRQQFLGLETKLAQAIGDPAAIDPESDEPLPAAVVGDVRAAADSAVGAVKFWQQFSLPTMAGTQLSELLRAALRPRSGWLTIAARSDAPAEETAERVAGLLALVQVLHDDTAAPLKGLQGWVAEVAKRGLPPARVRAVAARLAEWFPDAAAEEGR